MEGHYQFFTDAICNVELQSRFTDELSQNNIRRQVSYTKKKNEASKWKNYQKKYVRTWFSLKILKKKKKLTQIIEKWRLLPYEVYVQINIGHLQKVGARNLSLHHGLLKVPIANNELLFQWCQVTLGTPVLSMCLCTLQTLEDVSRKHMWCFKRPLFSLRNSKKQHPLFPFSSLSLLLPFAVTSGSAHAWRVVWSVSAFHIN